MSELVALDGSVVANLARLAADSTGMSRTAGPIRVGPWALLCSGRVMMRAAECDGVVVAVVMGGRKPEFDWFAYTFDGDSGTTLKTGAAKTAQEALSSADAWMRDLLVSAIGKTSGREAKRHLMGVLRDMDDDNRVVNLDADGPSDD